MHTTTQVTFTYNYIHSPLVVSILLCHKQWQLVLVYVAHILYTSLSLRCTWHVFSFLSLQVFNGLVNLWQYIANCRTNDGIGFIGLLLNELR